MRIHPRTIEKWKLEAFKAEITQLPSLSMYEIAKIIMAKYKMEVMIILHKHIKNDKNKRIP